MLSRSRRPSCLPLALLAALAVVLAPGAWARPSRRPSAPVKRKAARVALRGRLANVRQKMRVTKARLVQAKRSEAMIAADLHAIKVRLEKTRAQLKAAKLRLEKARREQARLDAILAASRKKLADRQHILARRMAANYRQGPVRYASVVLGSRSMGELVSRAQFVRTIVKHDATLIAEIKRGRAAVVAQKRAADASAAEVSAAKSALAGREAEIARDVVEQHQLLAEAAARRAHFEDELDTLRDDSEQIAGRLRALMETPIGRARHQITFSGHFGYPVDGPITSGFGERFHPILHRSRLHAGIDFGAGTGAPISAAESGVVVFSGTMRGYGNVVVVDHGGGVSTLYAHCSARLVEEGTSVSRGQIIARVGATGLATGPHLHFEVRKNGTPVNPIGAF